MLARGQQGSKPFDNLSLFDGDFGAFDESGSYNFVPNKRPHFSFF